MDSIFKYYQGSLEEFITDVKNINDNRLMKIKLIPSALPEYPGYSHVIDNFAVNHIISKHTNEKEVLRGQAILQNSDFLLIPHIVSNYDSLKIESIKNKITVLYTKECYEHVYHYIEEVRMGRRELAGVTFYKRKKKLTDAKSSK